MPGSPEKPFYAGFLLFLLFFSCGRDPAPALPRGPESLRPKTQHWEGRGNRTIGFTSETGVFRISWKCVDPVVQGSGTFRLTVRSAISGRELRTIADQKGEGSGSFNFSDDPRLYELLVDSSGVRWAISIDEGGAGAR